METTLNLADLRARSTREPIIKRYVTDVSTRCETCHTTVPAGEVLVRRRGGWITCEPCSL